MRFWQISEAIDSTAAYVGALQAAQQTLSWYAGLPRRRYSDLKRELRWQLDNLLGRIGNPRYPVGLEIDYYKDGETTGALGFAGKKRNRPRIVLELATLVREYKDPDELAHQIAKTFAHEYTHYVQHDRAGGLTAPVIDAISARVPTSPDDSRERRYLGTSAEIHAYAANAARELMRKHDPRAILSQLRSQEGIAALAADSPALLRYAKFPGPLLREFLRVLVKQLQLTRLA